MICTGLSLAMGRNISDHCASRLGNIMTAILDGKDHLLNDYLVSVQFDGAI